MKCSESWLREWVNPKTTREQLCQVLTMAGLEVEDMRPVAADFSGVIVGEISKIERHPEADRLTLCEVNIGKEGPLEIVCGAQNVRAGMKAPVAVIGAKLPNDVTIKPVKLRGIASEGMLCSARELGLAEESEGLLALSDDAPIGVDIRDYLMLNDYIIEIGLTPNRGDCLSVKGLAREVSAITQTPQNKITSVTIPSKISDKLTVSVTARSACPRYVGRIIRNVKADLTTPTWLKERLIRSGTRSISPIVDVTNYVMYELGQPMHAFDLDRIDQEINVRLSKKGEKISLLDGTEKDLDNDTLLIADSRKPLAIAGVMGGVDSSVTSQTKNIFLESAFFSPKVIARQRQFYNLNSDSAYRFERGVDPDIQHEAIERATQLILEITDGEAGPIVESVSQTDLPKELSISLTPDKVTKVLGIVISAAQIESIFNALQFEWKKANNHWQVKVPSYRFDITLAEDIIEEIARLYGYNNIPTHFIHSELKPNKSESAALDLQPLRQILTSRGYHEIISYSFVDQALQSLLNPDQNAKLLLNPITSDMNVMRTNLWPGLITALLTNKNRQQHRLRLFEAGTCFISAGEGLTQATHIAGLITGGAQPEQWGIPTREVDFFDLKGDVLALLANTKAEITFKVGSHPALHPGQTAEIYIKDQKIGILGALHPTTAQALDISEPVFVFEIDLNTLPDKHPIKAADISKFPEIRRDIAILVKQAIPAAEIQDTIKVIAGDWLKDVFIFDVYQGKGISPGLKSIALGLVIQHPTRTLVDDEVTELMERVIKSLKGQLGAELRS